MSDALVRVSRQAGWGAHRPRPEHASAEARRHGSEHDRALILSVAPYQATWAWSAAEDASPGYNSDTEGDRFSSWAIPGTLAVTKGILASFDNDPSAGSPTETLLRLLLPLNDKVHWTSRDIMGSEPPTSSRSEHFTRPFNRLPEPVIASNFLGLSGHSPSKKLATEDHLHLFVFHKSKNFTSNYEIRMPPTVPGNHYSDLEGQHNRIRIL
ncbi:hypothetical protein V6N13_081705 [Hibiscus sabdariffa]